MSINTVLYPSSPQDFNIDYYLSTHMPLVAKIFGPFGLTKWEVLQFAPTAQGPPQFVVQTLLHWESEEGMRKANASEGAKKLVDDIKNFSGVMPVGLEGRRVGSS
ncbi:Hypothetical protein D9617_14g075680 [Elsinoe fawcettii]|nr:Hypothetical protein D9617_14g075680 [Elsinoe fawcettii]